MKILATTLALMVSPLLLAEASIQNGPQNKTYLLEAPGTISGMGQQRFETDNIAVPPPRAFVNPAHEPNGQGRYRFPQYGQKPARDNPWHEMTEELKGPRNVDGRPTGPSSRGSHQQRAFQNPWDLRNLPDFGPSRFELDGAMMGDSGYSSFGYGYNSPGMDGGYPSFSQGGMGSGLPQPVFPYSELPYMNGMLPGLGNDDSNFPFMPFDMF